ncbi:hypothetical protein [Noviherbaspirillum massiliense]|uniref:hypothetical protein n=1 Tax=Noviherbaspirillum massiliense TaxID=1465823 RepID=UPI0011DCD2B0|nr:hypothetical protein [Noviherbaspirillum massiliense]
MDETKDIETVSQYMKAAADGPFFPEWEFQTLFGLERATVRELANKLSATTPVTEDMIIAACNTFANLFGYPCGFSREWKKWVTVPPEQAELAFERWRAKYAPA